MARRVDFASNAGTPVWTDITDQMYLETARWGGTANRGEVDTGSGFDWRDDAGAIAVLPWQRRCRLVEEATATPTVMWQGRTVGSESTRGIIKTEDARIFDVSLRDVNGDFGGIGFASTHRPAETDNDRVRYFLDRYMSGLSRTSFVVADTYFPDTNPVNLPAFSYTDHQLDAVFNHIVATSGKQYFLTRDYELFYDLPTSTAYAAGFALSDTGYDFSTVFPPANVRRVDDATEFFGGVRGRYAGGQTTQVIRQPIQAANDAWRTVIVDESITTEAAMLVKLNAFLDEHQYARSTFYCTVDVPADRVDDISWGMTISARHAAWGLLSPVTLRIGRLSWELLNATTWRAHLELGVPGKMRANSLGGGGSAPPSPFVPGNDVEPSDEIVSLYEATTVVNPAQFDVPVSDTFDIIAGHPWRWTINFTVNTGGRVTINCTGPTPSQPVNAGAGPPGTTTWSVDELALASTVTGCRVYINGDSGQTLTTDGTDAGKVEYTDGSMLGSTSIPTAPVTFQRVTESFEGDGSTTDFQTNYPYVANSLVVTVGGVAVIPTQTDPEAGEFSLPFAPALGTQVVVTYQALNGTATGAANDPDPPSVAPTLPGSSLDLDDLGDVVITSPAEGDLLTFDGSDFVNAPLDPDVVQNAGRWEVVMAPGVTSPPDPVQTPEGDDWVYAWVTE